LILINVFKQNFISKFLTEFQKNEVSEKSVFGKTSFWKNGFYFRKEFLSKYSLNFVGVDL